MKRDHSHLTFFKHGEAKTALGVGMEKTSDTSSNLTLQANVIMYLQKLTSEQHATPVSILRELGIDLLDRNKDVLSMVRNNPKVEVVEEGNVVSYLKYRSKFNVHNKEELRNLIIRYKSGVSSKDLQDTYHGVTSDMLEMRSTGEVIANKNRDKDDKDIFLYPRGIPFFVELSGSVKAVPGDDTITCSENNGEEIRRGDVILIGGSGFRVDCCIEGRSSQPARAKPPLSVSSLVDHDQRGLNKYLKKFTENIIPLDGDYDGDEAFVGTALKHGCTNDLRALWGKTASEMETLGLSTDRRQFEINLEDKLIKLGLLTRSGSAIATKAKTVIQEKQKRLKSKKTYTFHRQSNTHLDGTSLGLALKHSKV